MKCLSFVVTSPQVCILSEHFPCCASWEPNMTILWETVRMQFPTCPLGMKTKVQAICICNYKLWFTGYIDFININENTSHYMQSTDVTGRPFFIVLDVQSSSKIIDFPSFLNHILCCVRYFQIITTRSKII